MALVRHISVAPNGRLDAVWYDTRNAANNTDSQLFYSLSTDAGVTWSPNVAVSNPFNPFEGYPNQNKIGDYITIVSDNTGGNVAYSATFNFNPEPGTTRRRRLLRARISSGRRHTDSHTYRDGDSHSDSYGNYSYCRRPQQQPTATATATATPRPTPTPRFAPTPRPRPTPPPRP